MSPAVSTTTGWNKKKKYCDINLKIGIFPVVPSVCVIYSRRIFQD